MIDIQQFRVTIGIFNYVKSSKVPYKVDRSRSFESLHSARGLFCMTILCAAVIVIGFQESTKFSFPIHSATNKIISFQDNICESFVPMFIGNFYARYLYGKISRNPKELKVYHINIRSLRNKINEVKKNYYRKQTTFIRLLGM